MVQQPQRLAVTLRMRHPEVALDQLLRAVTLLMGDHHDGPAGKTGRPADDGGVVAEAAVAVQLAEVLEDGAEVVERSGPVDVPGDLYDVPRVAGGSARQVGIVHHGSGRRRTGLAGPAVARPGVEPEQPDQQRPQLD